jgi:HAD superfamily phosphoserine phosphatase-like hydrolase
MKAKLICFDFDDTLTTVNSWHILNTALGITATEDAKMYHDYKVGTLSYLDRIDKISARYREHGLATKEVIENVLHNIALRPDAQYVIDTLQQRGYIIAIISGSFATGVVYHAHRLGVTHVFAGTRLHYDSEGNFVELTSEGDESDRKVKRLSELCVKYNCAVTDCAYVGNSANDIPVFRVVGQSICFTHSTDYIKAAAKTTIESLSDLLKLF